MKTGCTARKKKKKQYGVFLVVFPKSNTRENVKRFFLLCMLSAQHRWITAATADLLSEIRNGGSMFSLRKDTGSFLRELSPLLRFNQF